ncbi:MAG: hypothetical protein ACE5IR_06925 [bacterium]
MTLDDVLQDLIQCLGSQGDSIIAWEEVQAWPEEAVEIFQNAGWIKPTVSAKSVVCPGCEESCFMPVHIPPTKQGKLVQAFVACDQRDDMGRVPIPSGALQQWQVTENQLTNWLAREISVRGKPKRDRETKSFLIGDVQGKKRTGRLELVFKEPVTLKASEHPLSLNEIVFLDGHQLKIDRAAILDLIDRPPTSDRYIPSIARREARKLETQAIYKSWQKAYRTLKRKNSDKSDNWCALQIAKMDIAQGRGSETIRKNMKK